MVNVAGHETPDENPNADPPPDEPWSAPPPPPGGWGQDPGVPPLPDWGAPPQPPFGPVVGWPGAAPPEPPASGEPADTRPADTRPAGGGSTSDGPSGGGSTDTGPIDIGSVGTEGGPADEPEDDVPASDEPADGRFLDSGTTGTAGSGTVDDAPVGWWSTPMGNAGPPDLKTTEVRYASGRPSEREPGDPHTDPSIAGLPPKWQAPTAPVPQTPPDPDWQGPPTSEPQTPQTPQGPPGPGRSAASDPWRIPPQAPWDPSADPAPGLPEAPEFPPYAAPSNPAHAERYTTALDLPPSATAPRSTPRPPLDPRPDPRSPMDSRTGPRPAVFDEPWRREAPGRDGGVRPRTLLIGVAGVVVAALIAGGVVLLTGGGGAKKPSIPGARLAGGLFAIDSAARTDGRDQELLNVTAAGSTVVAVGGEFNTDYRAEFFVSTDGGRSFRLGDVRTPDGQEPPYGDIPRRVAGTAGAWVALGNSPDGTVVWTSNDGTSWTRQPDDVGSAFNRPDRIGRIVKTRSGFAAVGDTSAKGDYSDASPVVWLSRDGRRWDRHSADQLGISANGRPVSLIDAASVGDVIVAHGWSTGSGSTPEDLTWRSGDGGRSWTPFTVPKPKGATGLGVTSTPGGFIAARNVAGTTGKGSHKKPLFTGVVLASPDGLRWSRAGTIQVPGYYGLRLISGSDRGLAALIDTGHDLTVVRSADGRAWNAAGTLPMPKNRDIEGVAVTAGATIVAGRDTGEDGNDALLEVRDTQGGRVPVDLFRVPGGDQPDRAIDALVPGRGLTLAVGSADGDGAVWTSTGDDRWNRSAAASGVFARPGRQRLLSAAQGGSGWLAVGYDGLSPKRPLVVTSPDGTTWKAADGDHAFEPSGGDQLLTSATAAGTGGHVIVGADGVSSATWYSADLRSWRRGTGSDHGDLDGKPGAERWMNDVASGSFGYVSAGGLNDPTAGNAPRGRPAVWTSADGKVWRLQQLPLPSGTTEATFAHVAAVNGRLMAAGTARTTTGSTVFAFVSPDGGKTWDQAQLPGADGASTLALTALTATPHGFVAAAGAGRGGRSDVELWTSPDGRSFTQDKPQGLGLSGRGDQWLTGLAPVGGDLLAVGVTADHRGEQPTLWRRPLP